MSRLGELIAANEYRLAKDELMSHNVVDIATIFEELDVETEVIAFRLLPKETAAEVFAYLSVEMQQNIVEALSDKELSFIIHELFIDDVVDFIEEMPANVVKRVLKNAKPDTREVINQFLMYPENSAGSIMTIEFVDLKRNLTVKDAFKRIRRTGVDKETIYTCYVTDQNRKLEGTLSVKALLLADPTELIEDIMDTNFICSYTTDDQEAIAYQFQKYALLSIPVVDMERRLVGIITVDDIVDVIQEEATEDFQKMAAMTPSEKPYLKTSVFSLAKNRILWLLLLMVSGMITGGILARYEQAFVAIPLLVTFIPMITGTGGNAGSQSSTLIIRGLALQEIGSRDILRVLWKELRVSLIVGTILATINFVRLLVSYPGSVMVALCVSLSLIATVMLAKTIGSILPIFARLIKADPAIMAAPLISTIVDALALVIYFSIANSILGL